METNREIIWLCPVCRNEESSNDTPEKCHICGTPGERLNQINKTEKDDIDLPK